MPTELSGTEWCAYIAGFFDGEGSVTIARQRVNGKSDYHCLHVTLSQRAKHRAILDRVAAEFGGGVSVRRQQTRIAQAWAEQAVWQLQHKENAARFLRAIQPYVIIKAQQVALGLEFLGSFVGATEYRHDDIGRIRGRVLCADEIERRERLRLAMQELNLNGPPRVKPSQLPPLDVQHRRRDEVRLAGNRETVRRGEHHGLARLNADQVRAIRLEHASGASQYSLARDYHVSEATIFKVVHRVTWQHVE